MVTVDPANLPEFVPLANPQRPRGELDLFQGTAVHESGHATLATYLRQEVTEIALEYHWTRDGTALVQTRRGYTVRYVENATPLDLIAVEVAGLAAESIPDDSVTLDYLERFEGTDYRHICEALDQLSPAPNAKQRQQIIQRQWHRSRTILLNRWPGVQALANALIDAGRAEENKLSGPVSEVRAVLSGAELAQLLAFARS